MNRRYLLAMLAAVLASGPLPADAQQPRSPVVGFVGYSNPERAAAWLAALHKGMADGGFVEKRTVTVEYRWADSDWSRVPGLVDDLLDRGVDVFVAPGGDAVVAAKKRTLTIPIVFAGHPDPVGAGYVESFKRRGDNVTRIAASYDEIPEKRLQLLHELVPGANRIGYLVYRDASNRQTLAAAMARLKPAATTLGVELVLLTVAKPEEIEPALADAKRPGIGAIYVGAHAFFFAQQKLVAELLARYALPAAGWGDFAAYGGLIAYAQNLQDIPYLAGTYVARILKGANPAELPVIQSDKHRLVINLKAAKALGLSVPQALLAGANEDRMKCDLVGPIAGAVLSQRSFTSSGVN